MPRYRSSLPHGSGPFREADQEKEWRGPGHQPDRQGAEIERGGKLILMSHLGRPAGTGPEPVALHVLPPTAVFGDAVILVLMDEDYEPYEIYQALREDLAEFVDASGGSRAKRGAMSVARFKIIGELVWDRVSGRQDGVWDNQAG